MDPLSVVITLGIAQGFYLGVVVLLMKSPNRRANRFLGFLLFSCSLSIVHFVFLRVGTYHTAPDLLQVSFPFLFLFGPLFYFYVRLLTDRAHPLHGRDVWHAVPFLLMILGTLPYHFLPFAEKLARVAAIESEEVPWIGIVVSLLQILQLACYLVAAHRILRAYEMRIRAVRSSIEQITLRWLQTGILMFVAIFGGICVLGVLEIAGIPAKWIYDIVVPLSVTVVNYTLGVLGLRQPEIFVPAVVEGEKGGKYQRSALTPERRDDYLRRLREVMEKEKPHRDPELTLPTLAARADIPVHHLSRLLNETVGQSFFDFVNRARVEEARRLLNDPSFGSYTILAVATEAGFNSKTAFNAAFKRHAGMTPSAYRTSESAR